MKEQQDKTNPVPFEAHYDIFKRAEERIKDHLSELPHDYLVAGLRLAYDVLDSGNEPDVLPYSVEFGYLGPLDGVSQCQEPEDIGEDELIKLTANTAITVDLLDELLDTSQKSLEEAANGLKLSVGIFIVLSGSPLEGYSLNCPCRSNQGRRKKYCIYNRKTKHSRCYCTTRGC